MEESGGAMYEGSSEATGHAGGGIWGGQHYNMGAGDMGGIMISNSPLSTQTMAMIGAAFVVLILLLKK